MENPDPPASKPGPVSMGGITRMHDPSELAHDRVRRMTMNLALIPIVVGLAIQVHLSRFTGRWVLFVFAWTLAGMPLGLLARLGELRFKMSRGELRQVLREVPLKNWLYLVAGAALAFTAVFVMPLIPDALGEQTLATPLDVSWALLGAWLGDFFTYYRHRHERLRHIYMVTATLEDLREFRRTLWFPMTALAVQVFALWHWRM